MRIQLLSFVCIGGLAATGLLLWHQPARAADDVKTIDILSAGPKFAEETVTISKGTTVKWVPKTARVVPHHLFQIDGTQVEITPEFFAPTEPTHTFGTEGVFKIQCSRHPLTMNQTITVTP